MSNFATSPPTRNLDMLPVLDDVTSAAHDAYDDAMLDTTFPDDAMLDTMPDDGMLDTRPDDAMLDTMPDDAMLDTMPDDAMPDTALPLGALLDAQNARVAARCDDTSETADTIEVEPATMPELPVMPERYVMEGEIAKDFLASGAKQTAKRTPKAKKFFVVSLPYAVGQRTAKEPQADGKGVADGNGVPPYTPSHPITGASFVVFPPSLCRRRADGKASPPPLTAVSLSLSLSSAPTVPSASIVTLSRSSPARRPPPLPPPPPLPWPPSSPPAGRPLLPAPSSPCPPPCALIPGGHLPSRPPAASAPTTVALLPRHPPQPRHPLPPAHALCSPVGPSPARPLYCLPCHRHLPLPSSTAADAESMDAELRQVANGFDYKTYYRCEEGYEEDATNVIENECRRLLENFRHEARVQAVRDYYATRRIRLDKVKCRDAKMEKEHYMKVPPRWCVDKMDYWEALVDQWYSETWEASHNNAKERRGKMARHNKTEAPQKYDLYAMAHTASYKKVAIQKEREAMLVAMAEKDKEIRELEERTTALVEAERARNDASNRAIYELFVPEEGDNRRRKRKNERKEDEEEEKKKKEREEDKKKEKKEEKKEKELLLLLLLPPSSSFSFSFFFSSSSPLPSPSPPHPPPPPSFTSSSVSFLLRSLDSSKKG
ncbi:hypothetical protein ZWY2020_034263 [Hordeum vulgare]|nr:hypothetical protein ZWY2020_034263 [Hordeum vulgare]